MKELKKEVFQLKTTFINRTENYSFGDEVLPLKDSIIRSLKDLYKYGRKEWGRCISKVYIGDGEHIGYCFIKRAKYDDSKKTYLQEVWATIEKYIETTTREYLPIN